MPHSHARARARNQSGFTLIELLIAITLMAVLAGLSWRGLDNLMRSRDISQTHVEQASVMQTVLAQWQADLQAIQPVLGLNDSGVNWDGRTLRITRRATTWRNDGADAGVWVVAWTLRNNQWLRWQSPALLSRSAFQTAWAQAQRWGQTPSSDDLALETQLLPLQAWQLTYFRGNTWSNPLSSAGNTETGTPTNNDLPDAIRLQIDLPASTGFSGRLTLDWVRPNFSNTKT